MSKQRDITSFFRQRSRPAEQLQQPEGNVAIPLAASAALDAGPTDRSQTAAAPVPGRRRDPALDREPIIAPANDPVSLDVFSIDDIAFAVRRRRKGMMHLKFKNFVADINFLYCIIGTGTKFSAC